MARMTAAAAAVLVMEKEGITQPFGAAINPLYAAIKPRNTIGHILARHVAGASHMAEGYTRAAPGNIGVCIGTSGPAGTDMITGLYSAAADSIQSSASPARRRGPGSTWRTFRRSRSPKSRSLWPNGR